MNINTLDFEEWFELLQDRLYDDGISYSDKVSVKQDYENGRDVIEVAEEISREYC